MSFTETSTDIRLEGPVLYAQCRAEDGEWCSSSLDLNEFIGNNDGVLDCNGSNFFETCSECGMNGSMLVAVLRQVDGSYDECILDLNEVVRNDNGRLVRA